MDNENVIAELFDDLPTAEIEKEMSIETIIELLGCCKILVVEAQKMASDFSEDYKEQLRLTYDRLTDTQMWLY